MIFLILWVNAMYFCQSVLYYHYLIIFFQNHSKIHLVVNINVEEYDIKYKTVYRDYQDVVISMSKYEDDEKEKQKRTISI